LCIGLLATLLAGACSEKVSRPSPGHLAPLPVPVIVPTPNPDSTRGFPGEWLDSYERADSLGAELVVWYYSLQEIEADLAGGNVALDYFIDLARAHRFGMIVEVESPMTEEIGYLPADMAGLDFSSSYFRSRYGALVQALLDHICSTDSTGVVRYIFFGNEIDDYFHLNTSQLAPWDTLLGELVASTHDLCPRLGAGTIVTYHDASAHGRTGWVKARWGPLCDIIGVTYYPEFMPQGLDLDAVGSQLDGMIADYGGPWKLGIVEAGVSADTLMGGSEEAQVLFARRYLAAAAERSEGLEFASLFFAVYPILGFGAPPFSDWVAGVSVYRVDGTPRPVAAVIREEVGKRR